jgi:hypothetical protein
MLTSTKPNKCRYCKVRMPEDKAKHVLHDECLQPWLSKQLAKQSAAREKKDRAEFKERKAKLKRIPDLIKEAQTAFNAFIRERDRDQTCICCGKPLGDGDIGGGFDCGHYRSTGSAPHLRFDERNAHGQTKRCNRWGAGRAVDYRIGLVHRLGVDVVHSLEADNRVHKWQRDELIAIRAEYVAKLKELKRSQE